MERRWRSRSRGPAKAKANVAGRWGKNGGKNDVAKKMAGDPKSNAVGPSVTDGRWTMTISVAKP